jgi:hypothetical protein
MANLTSVLNQLEQERASLTSQLERLNTAPLSTERNRLSRNPQRNVRRRSGACRCRSTSTMGEGQGTEGRFNHRSQEDDVASRAQTHRRCTESTVGEMAKGAKGLRDGVRCTALPTPAQASARLFHRHYWRSLPNLRVYPLRMSVRSDVGLKRVADREVIIPPQRKSA